MFPRNVKDRLVQYPKRYQLTLVGGTADTYDLEAVPGTITEEGTDINKAHLQPIDNELGYFSPLVAQKTALTYTSGVLTKVTEYWPDLITVKTETSLVYTSGTLTSVLTKRNDTSGMLINTITETLIYTNGVLTNVERTVL